MTGENEKKTDSAQNMQFHVYINTHTHTHEHMSVRENNSVMNICCGPHLKSETKKSSFGLHQFLNLP